MLYIINIILFCCQGFNSFHSFLFNTTDCDIGKICKEYLRFMEKNFFKLQFIVLNICVISLRKQALISVKFTRIPQLKSVNLSSTSA